MVREAGGFVTDLDGRDDIFGKARDLGRQRHHAARAPRAHQAGRQGLNAEADWRNATVSGFLSPRLCHIWVSVTAHCRATRSGARADAGWPPTLKTRQPRQRERIPISSDAETAPVDRGTTMAQQDHDIDPFKVSSPRIFLVRMLVFLTLGALLVVILYKQIWAAFLANPGLNALIVFVLLDRHHVRFPPGDPTVSRGRLGQQLPPRRSRPRGRTLAGAARADGHDPARPHRPHGDVAADHARHHGFDREPPRRGARPVALHDRSAGLPRPARHVLGADRDGQLGPRGDRGPQGRRRRRPDVRFPQGRPRGPARRHGHFVLVLAVRPCRIARPRLSRPADRPGAEPLLHRPRGLARHHGARPRRRCRSRRASPRDRRRAARRDRTTARDHGRGRLEQAGDHRHGQPRRVDPGPRPPHALPSSR